jgi:hypothetical protein
MKETHGAEEMPQMSKTRPLRTRLQSEQRHMRPMWRATPHLNMHHHEHIQLPMLQLHRPERQRTWCGRQKLPSLPRREKKTTETHTRKQIQVLPHSHTKHVEITK